MDQKQPQATSPALDSTLEVQEPASKRARLSTPESSHSSSELNNTTTNTTSTTTEHITSPTTATANDLTSSLAFGHVDLSSTSNTSEQQQQQDLDAINQLQQLSEAHSQLAQVAAAAGLSGDNNFQFLTNLENSIAASVMAAAAATNTTTGSSAAASGANSPDTTASATTTTTATNTGAATPNLQSISPNIASQEVSDQQKQQQQQQQLNNLNELPTEILKRELMNQKVRADNRERKKRWRQQNEERNKDNDLRCRVNKRAHKLFGKEDSEHKRKWIDEEFLKRQQKRKDKERRKGLVDDSLGGHHHNHHHHSADGQLNAAAAAANGALDLAALAQHLQPQPSLSTMTDANYLTLLCNNLGIPAAARSIIGTHNAAAAAAAAAAATTAQQTDESQQQTLSNAGNLHDTDIIKQETSTAGNLGQQEEDDKSLQSFPFQLLELLQQLQQYQPQQTPHTHTEPTPTTTTAPTTTSATHTTTPTTTTTTTTATIADPHHGLTADATSSESTDFQLQQQFNAAMSDRPEDKLAALLASTLQAAATAASQGMRDEHDASQPQSSTSGETSQHTTVNQQEGEQQLQLNNSAEFPMDAVLTLMQLNAGWRH
ncbi:hypothetical protein V8B55DRAFT_1470431 [Mucor lusitanicus]|uniref:DUF3020 domain-containing protein n=1 Tax=Mucor circinelloides f. lusitanicus TaxID=29924 RepID=A0A8H4B749_MUCCL|nr:hypothetical protein FB192DRAFT_1404424 [Mucor lusitanicus]